MSHSTHNRLFRRRSSQPISWFSTEKLNQTQQKQTRIHNKIYYNIKFTQKIKPGLVTFYNLRPGKKTGLFSSILEAVDKSVSK